jgi:hypothetical protein
MACAAVRRLVIGLYPNSIDLSFRSTPLTIPSSIFNRAVNSCQAFQAVARATPLSPH